MEERKKATFALYDIRNLENMLYPIQRRRATSIAGMEVSRTGLGLEAGLET